MPEYPEKLPSSRKLPSAEDPPPSGVREASRSLRRLPGLRSYTLAVVLLGVLALILVVGFVLLSARRIREMGSEETRDHLAREQATLGQLLDVAFLQGAARSLTPPDPEAEGAWRGLAVDLEEVLRISPLLLDLQVEGRRFQIPYLLKLRDRPQGVPVRSVRIEYPVGASVSTAVSVVATYRTDPLQASRDRLMTFLVAGTVGLAIALYLLIALFLLVNRVQSFVEHRARERTARLHTVGDVASGLAHEVRNPLNAVGLHLQYLEKVQEKSQRPPAADDYRRLHGELSKLRTVVDHFVAFARTRDPIPEPVDLLALWREVQSERPNDSEFASIRFQESRSGDDFFVEADRVKIADVFRAALRQSIEAARQGAEPTVSVSLAAGAKSVRVSFEDSGTTPDAAAISRLFRPSFQAQESLPPLAMTLAKIVVESHGGRIGGSPSSLGGVRLDIELPRRILGAAGGTGVPGGAT